MFSKPLFKQSCKANGTMWIIITFAVCFMLASVMLICGKGNIGSTIEAFEDTVICEQIDSSLRDRSTYHYETQIDGMQEFDKAFCKNAKEAFQSFAGPITDPAAIQTAVAGIYEKSVAELTSYVYGKAASIDPAYTPDSDEAQEMLFSVLFAVNPGGRFDEVYTSCGEAVPADYFDFSTVLTQLLTNNFDNYIASEERERFIVERSRSCVPIFLASNVTTDEYREKIVAELEKYAVTPEKYDGYGYNYQKVSEIASAAVVTYSARLEAELSKLDASAADYEEKAAKIKASLRAEISASFMSSLPEEVSSALEEIGQMNLYGLVVGSIFYKLAGLLLPIIYMIMASNNLIAGQVDSGSMAYVLSTSVKRKTVAFTQAVFLVSSLLCMFALTTVTGVICLAIVGTTAAGMTYGQLILLNVGAFLALFTLSGLCFFTSCYFDRSKRSMAVGGGLSIFSLVAAMLGLFGSKVIPKVVRLDALNNFNYATIISLFDAVSIIGGTMTFLWKFAILAALGLAGYVLGSAIFVKKDLPL